MQTFFNLISLVCEIISIIIVIRALLSWVVRYPNLLTKLIDQITEPLISPIRRLLPQTGGIDFSPMIAIILLQLIRVILP
ncbi:YggT family protein [Chloroflexota bacterium]